MMLIIINAKPGKIKCLSPWLTKKNMLLTYPDGPSAVFTKKTSFRDAQFNLAAAN